METGATTALRMETGDRMRATSAKLKDASSRIISSRDNAQFIDLAQYLSDIADELVRKSDELQNPAIEYLEAKKKYGASVHESIMAKRMYRE